MTCNISHVHFEKYRLIVKITFYDFYLTFPHVSPFLSLFLFSYFSLSVTCISVLPFVLRCIKRYNLLVFESLATEKKPKNVSFVTKSLQGISKDEWYMDFYRSIVCHAITRLFLDVQRSEKKQNDPIEVLYSTPCKLPWKKLLNVYWVSQRWT